MAYRLEEEPNGKEAIVIDGWDKGIASSPSLGMNAMLQVDLEVPGEVSVGYPITANATSGATMTQPIARSVRYFTAYNTRPAVGTGVIKAWAILDDSGQVFEATTPNGTFTFLSSSNSLVGSTNKDGVVYYLGFLLKTRGANIDYWNGSTWSTGWQTTLSSTVKHFMFVSDDNTLFITNGNNLASVVPVDAATFTPADTATYTFSTEAIAGGLPFYEMATCMGEVGGGNSPQSTLLIGGAFNVIYPWDKLSQSYSLPIKVADTYITTIVSGNQNAFILTGGLTSALGGTINGRGRIYITNGSQADVFFKIPDYIFGSQDPYYSMWDGIFHRNNLLIALQASTNSNNSIITTASEKVWAIDFTTKMFRAISSLPTDANTNIPTVLMPATGPGFGFIVGYTNNNLSAAGLGYSGTAAGIGSATITTDLIPVGTFTQKRTFAQVEVKLRSPLQSGESITLTPIVDSVSGTALTFSPTLTSGAISGVAPINFTGAQWLQFSVAITGNSASGGGRLKEIRIR